MERFLILLARRRNTTLAVALIGFVVLALQWPRLHLDDSAQRWMPMSSHAAWARFREHFASGDSIAVGMEFSRPVRDEDVEHLRALRNALEAVDDVLRVYDVSLVAEGVEGVSLTTLLAPKEKGRFDLYRGALFDGVGRDGLKNRTLVTICELREFEVAELREAGPRVVRAVDEVLARHRRMFGEALEGITFHLAGGLVVQRELERIARQMAIGDSDLGPVAVDGRSTSEGGWINALPVTRAILRRPPLLPLCLLVALTVFAVGFRSVGALLVTLVGVLWASAVVLGGVAVAGISLNVVTVSAPSLMAVIGMATAIHFAHYQSETHEGGSEHQVRWVAVPCLGAALTTGTGFLMLAFNELRPIRELGFELFLGALLAFFGVYLASFVVPFHRTAGGKALSASRLGRSAAWMTQRPRFWVGAMFCLVAALLYSAGKVYVDADPFAFFRPDSAMARALRHLTQKEFGLYPLEVALMPRGETEVSLASLPVGLSLPDDMKERVSYDAANRSLVYRGVMNTAGYARLRRLSSDEGYRQALEVLYEQTQDWKKDTGFRRQVSRFVDTVSARPEMLKVLSTESFEQRVEQFQASMRELVMSNPLSAVAEVRRTMQQVAVFQEQFIGWSTDRADEGAVRITLLVHDRGEGFGPLVQAVKQAVPQSGAEAVITGTVATVVTLSENLVGGIALGLGASLIVMGVLCGVLLGSVRLALIAALPNLFPLVVVFGTMGLTCWGPAPWAIPVNSGSAMVATIALGIALNDTIHFLMYYRRQTREEGLDVHSGIERTFAHVGRPIVLTSIVHIVGFSIFLLSDFQPLYHFGLLSMLAMAAALVGDLVLLPNLLVLFDRRARPVQSQSMSRSLSASGKDRSTQ